MTKVGFVFNGIQYFIEKTSIRLMDEKWVIIFEKNYPICIEKEF